MELIPTEPPGNAQRKLRGLLEEIGHLRQRGYSIRVIHETLLKAGVQVSKATVQRELRRAAPGSTADSQEVPAAPDREPRQTTLAPSMPVQASPVTLVDTGEPIPQAVKKMSDVDAFFERHIGNPLFRKKGFQ